MATNKLFGLSDLNMDKGKWTVPVNNALGTTTNFTIEGIALKADSEDGFAEALVKAGTVAHATKAATITGTNPETGKPIKPSRKGTVPGHRAAEAFRASVAQANGTEETEKTEMNGNGSRIPTAARK